MSELKPGVTRKMIDEALVALHSEWESRPRNDERHPGEFMLEQAALARAEVVALKEEVAQMESRAE